MEESKQLVIYGVLIALIVIACGFFLSASGIDALQFASIKNLMQNVQKLVSAEFVAFLLAASIFFAAANAICLKKEKQFAYKAIFAGSVAGLAFNFFAFGITTEKTFLAVFLLISIAILIEAAFLKKEEFKKFIAFRTADNATKKAILMLAAGLFASTAFIIASNNALYVKNFEQATLDIALGQAKNETIVDASTSLVLQSNKQALQLITQTRQFEKLKAKTDPEVQSFMAMMESMQSQIESPELRETVKKQVEAGAETAKKAISFDLIKKQLPFIQTLENLYWLITAIGIASIFLFIGNIIISPLASLFTSLFLLIAGKFPQNTATN